MARDIKVIEQNRDDELGIIKKEIRFPGVDQINTPTKSFTCPTKSWKDYDTIRKINCTVNEIRRRFDENTINNLKVKGTSMLRDIQQKFFPKKVNLTFFHLRLKDIPNVTNLNIFSNFIYCASESCIILPAVDSSFLKEDKIINEKRVMKYMGMIKNIIEEINTIGNSKPFIGMVPLVPYKYSRQILDLYRNEGIRHFIIDAGTADILGSKEFDFRMILSEINRNIVPLPDAFIYASNLGYGRFDRKWTIADDFLSLFAYIDVFGGTFKTRGFKKTSIKYTPRAKMFSSEEYAYVRSSYKETGDYLGIPDLNPPILRDYNEDIQLLETQVLGDVIGEIKMISHLQSKRMLKNNPLKIQRLQNIAEEIKIT